MATWSKVKVSELEGTNRLDPEYYRPEYLKYKDFLFKYPLLEKCIKRIIHPVEIKRVYENAGLHILLAQNILHNFLDFGVSVFMPKSVESSIHRNKLLPNDVVMTRSGANFGDTASYFGEPDSLYTCADDLVIRPNSDLPAGYLSTFFNTKIGRALIKRGGYGAGQPHIAPPYLKMLHIPRFSNDIEKEIDGLVRTARDWFKHSEILYLKAEQTLLNYLSWYKLNRSQPKSYSIQLSEANSISRMDAEHFQPKHKKLVSHIKNTGKMDILGDIVSFNKRGVQPTYVVGGEVIVVNSQHLGRYLLNVEATERTDENFWLNNKRCQLKLNDILLYSTGAYVGRTNVWLEDSKAIASNHVNIIRPDKEYNPLYLAVYLNSFPGLWQAEKWASGSGQRELYPQDIAKFVVYRAPKELQEKIADLVLQSYQARKKAKALLEEAKKKVEDLIEKKTL